MKAGMSLPEAAARPSAAAAPRTWTHVALALLLAAPLLLRLGAAPLFDIDEGAFSEATREMLESGDFGFTTLNGTIRFDKPILVYWLQAACVALFGVNEMAFRLPSALCAWGWALATVRFAMPRFGRETAWLAGIVTVTSLGVLVIGRAATADGLLNLLLALTLFDVWRHLESGERAPLLRAYGWIGLGLLAKGPVAVLVPGGTVLLYCLLSGRGRDAWRAFTELRGWLLTIVIALPWYAYALHRHGQAFIDGFIVRHNLARYGSVLEGHSGSSLYYLLMVPLLVLPWSALLVPMLARWRHLWAEPVTRFLLAWVAFVVVFFSFSHTKLPHYALYGCTPLFLLLADTARKRPPLALWLVVPAAGALLALFAMLPMLAVRNAGRVRDPMYRALLEGAAQVDGGGLALVAALAVAFAAAVWWLAREPAQRLAGSAMVVALVVGGAVWPWAGLTLQGPVREAGLLARERGQPAWQWGINQPSFSVYRQQSTHHLGLEKPLPPGSLGFTRADRLPSQEGLREVWRGRGFVMVEPAR
jgi:4-amino-4-deoxy-L-arabinose transferase-like glycosyltransferase